MSTTSPQQVVTQQHIPHQPQQVSTHQQQIPQVSTHQQVVTQQQIPQTVVHQQQQMPTNQQQSSGVDLTQYLKTNQPPVSFQQL